MNRNIGIVIGVVALVYVAAALFLYSSQRDLMYFPTPAEEISGFDRIEINSEDQTLDVWAARRSDYGEAIVYFGGNAESLLYTATLLNSLFPGKSIYLPYYRGYGGSAGQPSESAIYQDALAVYDWVDERHSKVSVIGRSLGSGVATYLGSQRELKKLVLVTAYDSLEKVAGESFYMFPVSWLLKDKYDSVSRADAITEPTLMITADNDEVITRAHSDRLHAALDPAKTEEVIVDGTTHNDIATKREYAMALLIFLDSEHVPVNVQ